MSTKLKVKVPVEIEIEITDDELKSLLGHFKYSVSENDKLIPYNELTAQEKQLIPETIYNSLTTKLKLGNI